MKPDKNLMSVSSSLLVLNILKEKDMYGYEIINKLSVRSQNVFEFKEGTLYPVLHTMEKDKYIESYSVKTEQNRTRKYYKLTALGAKQLAKKKAEWNFFAKSLSTMLESKLAGRVL